MTKPQQRQKTLIEARNLKMARSAHAYVRGSTVKFYEWLGSSRRCQFPDGPGVWICGDCHVGNLGPIADAKGRVLIQIRDLDQTVIGNPAHDLIRLGLSLASASRGSDLPGVTTAKILEELISGYRSALSGNFETNKDNSHEPKSIQNSPGAIDASKMATPGGRAARFRQARYPPGKAFLGAGPGRAQGSEPNAGGRFCPSHA